MYYQQLLTFFYHQIVINCNKLKINRVRTEHFKGTFFNRIPYLWNNLPDALRTTSCSVFSFKRLCTIFYKDRVFDPDHPNVTWA